MVNTKTAVPMVRRAIAGAVHDANPPPDSPKREEGQESHWSPEALEKAGSALKALNRMTQKPPVHLQFEDISYTVDTSKGEQRILRNISGEFPSGELTCVLGPSGAGKSTLLNIIAGYTSNGVTGRITVNGHNRNMRVFKKLSTYIMQDDLLQPRLTVMESMRIAADLKLGDTLGRAEKDLIIKEILETLGLWNHKNTMSERLSGGQLKRLSIAVELVNNPPVIFLDEPTTGLDVVSIRQLVVLLRLLSRQGRTIICTIHQPSATLFNLFDRIYVLAKGVCSYQGVPHMLVPHLAESGYVCPTNHNPADFVIETLQSDMESIVRTSELCQNGKICKKITDVTTDARYPTLTAAVTDERMFVEHVTREKMHKLEFPTTFWAQFIILSKRMFVQNIRDTTGLWIQLIYHVSAAVMVGGIFFDVGNNAAAPIVNFKFCVSCLVFILYSHVLTPILIFPFQVRLLRREYFNRWYSLKAYYAALTLSTLPLMIILTKLFVLIAYFMSGQILEWNRILLFYVCALVSAACSEGFGLAIGAAFDVANGSIIGPSLSAPLLALSFHGMGYGPNISEFMQTLMSFSYMRYGVVGIALSIYKDREPIQCPEMFCMYSEASLILRDVGIKNDNYWVQIMALILFSILHRICAYLALRYNLTAEFSNKFMIYLSKLVKHR